VGTSATFEVSRAVARLKGAGEHVFDLGLGEADYPAPRAALDALAAVAATGRSCYTSVNGTLELRRAAARSINGMLYRQSSVSSYYPSYSPDDIVISAGSKHLQYSAVLSLCDPGDEVILFSPYWVSYPDVVRMAGAVPVVVPSASEDGFVPPVERIAAAITDRTRLIILNSPSNPTGQLWSAQLVDGLCDLVLAHDGIYLLSDEIYAQLVYGDAVHHSPVAYSREMRDRTIVTTGLSKAFSMAGWRVGYAAVSDCDVRSAMLRVGSNTISCVSSVIQAAAVAAFDDRARLDEMRIDFEDRARLMQRRLREIGIPAMPPQGAFYIFADVSGLFGRTLGSRTLRTTRDVSMALLERARVASVAGEAFGDNRHIRFSFVRPLDELEAACEAIESFVGDCTRSKSPDPVHS